MIDPLFTQEPLPEGYAPLRPGYLATMVTVLEMHQRAPERPERAGPWQVRAVSGMDADAYLDLFRRVGQDYLWTSRLEMPRATLEARLAQPLIELLVISQEGRDEGFVELDFREPGVCEISMFGVAAPLVGTGAARSLMNAALKSAWRAGISKVWLHTCTLDHPKAVDFYTRSGFTPTRRYVEILPDPRLKGFLPKSAAPQVPLVEG